MNIRGIKIDGKEFKLLGKTAMELGKTTVFSAYKVAEEMQYLAMAGYRCKWDSRSNAWWSIDSSIVRGNISAKAEDEGAMIRLYSVPTKPFESSDTATAYVIAIGR